MLRTPAVHAQLPNCYTYNTWSDVPCYTCCSGGMNEMNITDGTTTGAGIQNSKRCTRTAARDRRALGLTEIHIAARRAGIRLLTTQTVAHLPALSVAAVLAALASRALRPACGNCISTGQSCQGNPGNCCTGLCDPNFGNCASCLSNQVGCSSSSQCCSGFCYGSSCCAQNGGSCNTVNDCCDSNFCSGGVCTDCLWNDQPCSDDFDCCTGYCDPGEGVCEDEAARLASHNHK